MKVSHREWMIRSTPERKGHHWHAWVEVERGPWRRRKRERAKVGEARNKGRVCFQSQCRFLIE
jgi:hypothetical protein